MQKLRDMSFGAKGKSPQQRLQAKIEIWLLRTEIKVPSENCWKIGFFGQLTHPIIYAAVLESC